MSGRKYSLATLNQLKKKEILAKSELSRTLALSKEKLVLAREFEKEKGEKLSKTILDLEKLISNLKEWNISEFNAQDHHYNYDLENAESKLQAQIAQLTAKKSDLQGVEKNIHQLKFLCDRKTEVVNSLEEFKKFIRISTERVQRDLAPFMTNFVMNSKDSILQSFNHLEASSNHLSVTFNESADQFLKEITETEIKMSIMRNKLSTLDSETKLQVSTILEIESTDEKLKKELREKFQKREEVIKVGNEPSVAGISILKQELSRLKQRTDLHFFENTLNIIQSADILLEKHVSDAKYLLKSLEERINQLRKLETKYISLKNRSDMWKLDIHEALTYHIRKKESYSIHVKWSVADIEAEWETISASDLLSESEYQALLKKILRLQEMIDIEAHLEEQSSYIRDALKLSLEELGYDVESEEKDHVLNDKRMRILEFPLSSRVRVKMEISPDGKINSNLIYKTNDSEISIWNGRK
jgi:uncharacterized protein (UPF0218 family)